MSADQLDADDAAEAEVEPSAAANGSSRNAAGARKSSQVYISVFTVGMASNGNSDDACVATVAAAAAGVEAGAAGSRGTDGGERVETMPAVAAAARRRLLSLVFQ